MTTPSVTVLAHRRPDYFGETIAALARCDGVDDWRVVLVMDRPDVESRAIAAGWGWETVTLNLQNATDDPYARTSRATLLALSLGFATSDYVVHLEEDCLPSTDFLDWHDEMAALYRDDARVFTVNAWSGRPGAVHPQGRHLAAWFTPWGFGMHRDRFEEARRSWDFAYWDRALNERIRGDRLGVFPASSKVRNIGRIGYRADSTVEWEARELAPA